MVYNKENLVRFLKLNHLNVNSKLLLVYLGESSSSFPLNHQDQIMPEILVEVNNEGLKSMVLV
ncbi:hypothetical protein [Streptococcus sp. NLN76]|uniref:hypothetical protein n=1 Tax=Streptococcus sp. NLN76 TaxID=2822800 RepID=UPI0018ABE4FD|nr:hypothetical protein [Streptococcus sp. NLN76]MBF8971151.1 hypothetical protein [Streptococcus sp. NLN76]